MLVLSVSSSICKADDWTPPPPTDSDRFDWIELKSGEWLKGRIRYLRQEDLEFDSEELDIHIWDWDKILTVRSSRLLSMRFTDNSVIKGSLLVTKTEVQIVNESGTRSFPRSELLAIAPSGSHRRDIWSLDVSVGFSSRQGNTNEISNNSQLTAMRETPLSRQKFEYRGNYGKLEDVVNKEDQRWSVESDFFFSRRFFVRVPDLEYFHDPQQNLSYRITFGCSVGYDLIQTAHTEWQLTAGPALQWNSYNTEADTENKGESKAMVLGSGLEIELTKRLDFSCDYRGQFAASSQGGNMHHTVSTIEFEIHKRLTVDFSLTWDRIAEPEPKEDGSTPEPDDLQFITSLGIHF